jgi:hypothetical protein
VGRRDPLKGSTFVFGLGKADRGAAVLPLAALLEEFDALETLEDGTLAADGGAGFETVVLGHRVRWFGVAGGGN